MTKPLDRVEQRVEGRCAWCTATCEVRKHTGKPYSLCKRHRTQNNERSKRRYDARKSQQRATQTALRTDDGR